MTGCGQQGCLEYDSATCRNVTSSAAAVWKHRNARWKLRNARLPRPTPVATHQRVRLRNAKYQPPALLGQLNCSTTWDNSPLHGDASMDQLLHMTDTANMWKQSAVEEGMSDVETQEMSEARSSNSEDCQE